VNLLLSHRAFARTWIAGLVFMLAWWSLHAVMLIHVFTLTGSPFATGLIPVFSALPGILVGPMAGALVDRWSRPRVMTFSAAALVVIMLAAIPLASLWGVALLYLVIMLQSLAMTFFSPAENALLPSLVAPTELRTANALNALNDSIGRIAGPALGAMLLVTFGFQATLAVAAVLYLLGWAVLVGLRQPRTASDAADPPLVITPLSLGESVREGLSLVRTNTAIFLAVLVWALFMVADVPLSAVLPAFMQDSVGVSPEMFGGLMSVRGLTGLAGGLVVIWLSRRVDEGTLLIGGLLLYGFSIALMGVTNSMPMAALVLIPIGPASAAIYTGLTTTLQQATNDATRGRIFALSGTINSLIVLMVSFTSGSLATVVGTQAVVIASGCLQLLPVVVAIVIRRRRSRLVS
jgi:predicted MFS family arabinose efflux permease